MCSYQSPILSVLALLNSLAKPGGNTTGFMLFEYNLSGKWLELLIQVSPGLTRVVVLRDPANPAGSAQYGLLQALAPSFGVELRPVDSRDATEIERVLKNLVGSTNGGVVVAPSASESPHRDLIITLATRYKLPAVYSFPNMVAAGGLISYGPDRVAQFRNGAAYVDRILRGEKPTKLPVQAPTKYQLVIKLKTAKALGVPISEHHVVVHRTSVAVQRIERALAQAQQDAAMTAFNHEASALRERRLTPPPILAILSYARARARLGKAVASVIARGGDLDLTGANLFLFGASA